jgi:hypothetical protein
LVDGERERGKRGEKKERKENKRASFPLTVPSLLLLPPKKKKKISRGKAALLEGDIPNLERLSRKGLRRAPPGTSAERSRMVAAVKEAVAALADGLHVPAKRYFSSSGGGASAAGGGAGPFLSSPSSSPPNPSAIQALKSKGKTVIILDETKWGSRADADGYYSQSETAAGFRKVKKKKKFFLLLSLFSFFHTLLLPFLLLSLFSFFHTLLLPFLLLTIPDPSSFITK